MKPKIVFTDIDGTLLNKDRELSERTIETIKKVKEKVPVVLISARMPAAMRHLQQQLDLQNLPIICYNGGYLLDGEKALSSTHIPVKTLEKISAFNQNDPVHLSLYHAEEWHVPNYDYWAKREENNTKVTPNIKDNHLVLKDWSVQDKGAHKVMAMGDEEKIDALYRFLENEHLENLHLYRSKNTYIEVANKQISKLTAIQFLLDNYFNLKLSDAVAYGDNYNDVEMINGVGFGVAVENARPEAKEVANKITKSNLEDGVAISLEELFLN